MLLEPLKKLILSCKNLSNSAFLILPFIVLPFSMLMLSKMEGPNYTLVLVSIILAALLQISVCYFCLVLQPRFFEEADGKEVKNSFNLLLNWKYYGFCIFNIAILILSWFY